MLTKVSVEERYKEVIKEIISIIDMYHIRDQNSKMVESGFDFIYTVQDADRRHEDTYDAIYKIIGEINWKRLQDLWKEERELVRFYKELTNSPK